MNELDPNDSSWGSGAVCPRHLYRPKSAELKPVEPKQEVKPLRVVSCNISQAEVIEVKKKTIEQEQALFQQAKRRRPSLPATSETQEKLAEARLTLALETQKQMTRREAQEIEEAKRKDELHAIEKKKREVEAAILELQLKKLKKEMGESDI